MNNSKLKITNLLKASGC